MVTRQKTLLTHHISSKVLHNSIFDYALGHTVCKGVWLEGVDIICSFHKIVQKDFLMKGFSLFCIPSTRGSGSLRQ